MGQKFFTGIMVAIALGLVAWVASRQASNRNLVFESLDGIRTVVVDVLPDDVDRVNRIVDDYADQATGFERTVSRSELFLSRQAFANAMEDGALSETEAEEILGAMVEQMEVATSTVLRPTGEGGS